MKLSLLAAASLIGCLIGCTTPAPPPQAMTGSDRDAHGCIASAGYSWCDDLKQCERPWELAKNKGFESTPEAFDAFCKNPPAQHQ